MFRPLFKPSQDGLKQRPKHIASLNKTIKKTELCCVTTRTRQSLTDTFQQLKNNSMEVGLIINEKETKYYKAQKRSQK